jgi:peroxiredoxin
MPDLFHRVFNRRTAARSVALAVTAALTAAAFVASNASAAVQSGQAAPGFVGVDSNGQPVNLADYRGKTVILEWTNDGCPYVQAHYRGGMQALQKETTGEGIVWLSVISSRPGSQGYADGARANQLTKSRGAAPTRVVLDPKGAIGRLYSARTTPQMFVIDKAGLVQYQGAIDDQRNKNYVRAALADMKAGRPVAVAATKSYGCSVKY